ncbi:type II toxin-antitoxin system HipA family toxin [Cognataquiflexum rubidum]|uniref:type II toxin-antitoxin system HipA family toxin n=1 Tax=Cognataquiflexum rubidum TaxID=2922273 RepID=UPI001F147B3A|nr:HipA domain-containing protein [Cognataquiflexum rubidum]MCH6235606.1 HipA domain-containing protein [Cognataquiflexum rubidum]
MTSPAKTDIWVYAHWQGMSVPKCLGVLTAQQAKGRKAFGFSYDPAWISSQEQWLLDPDISLYSGTQYPKGKENFGIFLDSMPDNWGRTLMKRRALLLAQNESTSSKVLYDIDYLFGVNDYTRMGALRFKLDPGGPFLDNEPLFSVPPWTQIRDLQYGANLIESNVDTDEVDKWLSMLMAPGSSLGGARPKANIKDENGTLWIAKFPSQNDTLDKAAWEYLTYRLAVAAGIEMSPCKLEHVSGRYHTFFTKRFDRAGEERIHFASAMTMTGKNEEAIRDDIPSYLDILEFIQFSGSDIERDSKELWRRIVFNIMVSNTDDHLRNHGFVLTSNGWRLSPAFDLNPSIEKAHLSLNIDMDSNALDLGLAKAVGMFFRISEKEMELIVEEVKSAVANWGKVANEIGIPRNEQRLMSAAFRV